MKILIAEDHPVVAAGISSLVGNALSGCSFAVAPSTAEALRLSAAEQFDVAIVDLELGCESGIALIDKLRHVSPLVKILVYTMHEELWIIRHMLAADPDGVVLKSDDPAELVHALRMLHAGKGYFSASFNRLLNGSQASQPALSEREAEIVKLTAGGLSSAEISRRLDIAVATVEFHRQRVMRKLGAANAAEMVNKARNMGLLCSFIP